MTDWVAGLARAGEFVAGASATAEEDRSPAVAEDVSAGIGPELGQEEEVDPASELSRDPPQSSRKAPGLRPYIFVSEPPTGGHSSGLVPGFFRG